MNKREFKSKYHKIVFEDFKGKKIVLIDDVITTVRSFREIGDKLMYVGARRIYGVIFAMTIHPELPKKYNRKRY